MSSRYETLVAEAKAHGVPDRLIAKIAKTAAYTFEQAPKRGYDQAWLEALAKHAANYQTRDAWGRMVWKD